MKLQLLNYKNVYFVTEEDIKKIPEELKGFPYLVFNNQSYWNAVDYFKAIWQIDAFMCTTENLFDDTKYLCLYVKHPVSVDIISNIADGIIIEWDYDCDTESASLKIKIPVS